MINFNILRCINCDTDGNFTISNDDYIKCSQCFSEFRYINQRPLMVNSDFQGYSNLVESALKLKSRDLQGHINYWDQSIDPQKFFFKYLFPKCNKLDLQWKFLGHKVSLMAQGIYSNSNKNTIVLDVGAGDARYGAFFKKNTYVSTDLVFSSERHNFDNIDIISDVEKLSIANDYADYILNFALMEHVPHPDLVIKEMFRTLKKGGKIFSIIPLTRPEHMQPFDFFRFTQFSIRKLFSENGFKVESIKGSNNALWTPVHYLYMFCLTYPFENFKNRIYAVLINRIFFILLFPLVYIARKFDKYFPDNFPIYYWVECEKK